MVSPGLDRELRLAHELADLADALTLPAFHDVIEVETKADGTAVTATDRGVERRLRARIREVFPRHAVLGEEDGHDGPEDAPTWIIDPIDATANFVRGNPVFATLIALRLDGVEMLGVVSAPALGSRWDGVVGVGATQDGRAIHVSAVAELADAEISFGGLSHFDAAGTLDAVARAATATRRQRGFGDFWQHCLVAAGAVDVAMEAEVSTWDLAAVKPIVEAAGGRFTDLAGVATTDGGNAVSSNGHLHDAALALLR
ncbi:MAG: histidinol-phosphatase [Actinobacteria bacterium]|nr:histidinol-phosphatase [Actinomycetota bacterium]